MLTYLCRCCAAPLEVKQGATVCRCSYCDVMQTLPRLDHDEKAVLWERADALRRGAEYDRALAVYEELEALDPTDPDTFWCKTLCRYGVEYVEEQGSRRRVPTLNRIQYAPVIDDEDYHRATRLADNDQRRLYMEEAMRLEELRRATVEVSMTEQPYDVFICYKETDSMGRRTEDSVIAGQLYRALSAEGWRVFFARVSLEEKAGTVFEPYIFAALNSAKLMFAVGTSPENFNAVWVRNEWSRYLFRMSEKDSGELVVLYKNMLPEHLPEEFAHLQRYDMSAPDVMEDLLRGARKVLSDKSTAAKTAVESAVDGEKVIGVTAETLLRRAELALEDGEYQRAWHFCDRALDAAPENAQAYLIQLLAEYNVRDVEQLAGVRSDFTVSGRFRKYVRFADADSVQRLLDMRKKRLYDSCCEEMSYASTESMLNALAESFDELGDYLDSAERARECRERLESVLVQRNTRNTEQEYLAAKGYYELSDSIANLTTAKRMFTELGDYKDSRALAVSCGELLAELHEERAEELKDRRAEAAKYVVKEKKSSRLKYIIAGAIGCVLTVFVLTTVGIYSYKFKIYSVAVEHRNNGRYEQAESIFAELDGFSDSGYQLERTKYQRAESLKNEGKYLEAADLFAEIDYYDSYERERECRQLYKDMMRDAER